jgi:NAD(P)-dependent dehydrogenase (short-subunit alcohol dehydrogenase family)
MVAAGVPGRICNVSSQAGKKAWPMIGAYSAAKARGDYIERFLSQVNWDVVANRLERPS